MDKVTLSALINAMNEPSIFGSYYVDKADMTLNVIEDIDPEKMPESQRKKLLEESPDFKDFYDRRQDFCKVPESDPKMLIRKFAETLPDRKKQRLTKIIKRQASIAHLSQFLVQNDLLDQWSDFVRINCILDLIIWASENSIEYVDDLQQALDDSFDDDFAGKEKRTADEFEDISYIFSVSLYKGCYRHIRISSRATLYDLHKAIIDAFGFCDDHLHSFFMSNHAWDEDSEYGCTEDNYCQTTDTYLAEFDFEKGDKFLYIFDFGDEWRFQIKFLRSEDKPVEQAEVIRSVGEAPEQYPQW